MAKYVLDEDFHRALKIVQRQHQSSFQSRPKHQRRPKPAAAPSSSPTDDFPRVRILNDSGSFRGVGSIFGYGLPLDPPPASFPIIPSFRSVSPSPGTPFVISLGDAGPGQIVDAAPVGVVAAQINLTDASHQYADPTANQYGVLASGVSGQARILWREKQGQSGNLTLGQQWARVRLDPLSAIEDPWGVVYQTITAASGVVGGPITQGKGLVTLYLPPAPASPIGTAWNPGPNINCETCMPAQSTVPKVVIIRKSRLDQNGAWIYRAIAQSCADLASG